jgi:putative ABC transport system ATP-binding protein
MKIEMKNVIPVPLTGISFSTQSVWGNDILLESGMNYLVNAPSGTGKSTLIAMLSGTRNDFSGEILFDGKNSSGISLKQWAGLRREILAIVYQDLRLFPDLTAYENIALKAKLTTEHFKEKIETSASRIGIADRLHVRCRYLSLGQQQRVAILRGLMQPFRFLLLDEPFSHLDTKNIELASELIMEECTKNNAGLILTSLGEKYLFNYNQTLSI